MWSLGVTLFVFVFGTLPFVGVNQIELFNNIRLQRLNYPRKIDVDLDNLLQNLLNKNPVHRLSTDGVLSHQWLSKLLTPSDSVDALSVGAAAGGGSNGTLRYQQHPLET
jgi:serine/threonine protein kinase